MGRADPLLVASAQITGTALRCTQHRAITQDEALADIAAMVAKAPAGRRQELLDHAAALFCLAGPTTPQYPPALELLVLAGADRDRATAIKVARSGAPFTVAS